MKHDEVWKVWPYVVLDRYAKNRKYLQCEISIQPCILQWRWNEVGLWHDEIYAPTQQHQAPHILSTQSEKIHSDIMMGMYAHNYF